MAYVIIYKEVIPANKTQYNINESLRQQYLTNVEIAARVESSYQDSNITRTVYQGTVWLTEEAHNTFKNRPDVQTYLAERDAYNTQHGIIRTQHTLTI